jgi:hypothetical protein
MLRLGLTAACPSTSRDDAWLTIGDGLTGRKEMTVKDREGVEAYCVADILPGGSGENGRYVIVGFKLASAEGPPSVTHVAFRPDQFDRLLIQLLDNAARARTDRLHNNPPPEDAVLNIEAAALSVVDSSAEPSVIKDGRALICLKMDPGRGLRRLACIHFSFDEPSLEQLSDTIRDALRTLRERREQREQERGLRISKMN